MNTLVIQPHEVRLLLWPRMDDVETMTLSLPASEAVYAVAFKIFSQREFKGKYAISPAKGIIRPGCSQQVTIKCHSYHYENLLYKHNYCYDSVYWALRDDRLEVKYTELTQDQAEGRLADRTDMVAWKWEHLNLVQSRVCSKNYIPIRHESDFSSWWVRAAKLTPEFADCVELVFAKSESNARMVELPLIAVCAIVGAWIAYVSCGDSVWFILSLAVYIDTFVCLTTEYLVGSK